MANNELEHIIKKELTLQQQINYYHDKGEDVSNLEIKAVDDFLDSHGRESHLTLEETKNIIDKYSLNDKKKPWAHIAVDNWEKEKENLHLLEIEYLIKTNKQLKEILKYGDITSLQERDNTSIINKSIENLQEIPYKFKMSKQNIIDITLKASNIIKKYANKGFIDEELKEKVDNTLSLQLKNYLVEGEFDKFTTLSRYFLKKGTLQAVFNEKFLQTLVKRNYPCESFDYNLALNLKQDMESERPIFNSDSIKKVLSNTLTRDVQEASFAEESFYGGAIKDAYAKYDSFKDIVNFEKDHIERLLMKRLNVALKSQGGNEGFQDDKFNTPEKIKNFIQSHDIEKDAMDLVNSYISLNASIGYAHPLEPFMWYRDIGVHSRKALLKGFEKVLTEEVIDIGAKRHPYYNGSPNINMVKKLQHIIKEDDIPKNIISRAVKNSVTQHQKYVYQQHTTGSIISPEEINKGMQYALDEGFVQPEELFNCLVQNGLLKRGKTLNLIDGVVAFEQHPAIQNYVTHKHPAETVGREEYADKLYRGIPSDKDTLQKKIANAQKTYNLSEDQMTIFKKNLFKHYVCEQIENITIFLEEKINQVASNIKQNKDVFGVNETYLRKVSKQVLDSSQTINENLINKVRAYEILAPQATNTTKFKELQNIAQYQKL